MRELGELTDTRLRTVGLSPSRPAWTLHDTDSIGLLLRAILTNGLHYIGLTYGLITDCSINGHGQALYFYSWSYIVVSAGIFKGLLV